MRVKVVFLIFFLLGIVLGNLFSEGVDIEELKKNIKGNIRFINYMGPERIIQSRSEIINIGKTLAIRLARNGKEGRIALKYSVYHIIGPVTEKGLDADIISIDKNARVDHIKNVRRIISGYLMEAYGYSDIDASAIAVFVTLYNAVFRGNITYFRDRYKREVLEYLSNENAGISLKYYEWPGKTRLVIPLTSEARKGEISSVSTSEVSAKPVVEAARREEGKELKARKALVSIKEREVEEKKAEIASTEEKIKAEGKEKARLEREIEKKKRELEEAKSKGNLSEAEMVEKRNEIESLERAKKQKEEEIARLKSKGSVLKREVTRKEKEIREEREAIAEDQSKLKPEAGSVGESVEERGVVSHREPLYFLYGASGSEMVYRLVIMDFETMEIKQSSDLRMIIDRDIKFLGNGILVKAFDKSSPAERKKGLVSIFLLNPKTLVTEKSSKPIVWKGSEILNFRGMVYAIGIKNGNFKLLSFDSKLEIHNSSAINVRRNGYFCIYNNTLVVQDERGKIRLLNPNTLGALN